MTRSKGKEAQRNNMTAARVIGEVLKTNLGPRRMDKMLVDSLGDITITNDGARYRRCVNYYVRERISEKRARA